MEAEIGSRLILPLAGKEFGAREWYTNAPPAKPSAGFSLARNPPTVWGDASLRLAPAASVAAFAPNEKRLPGVSRHPGNLLTWSAAGSSSLEDHAKPENPDRRQRCLGKNAPRRHPKELKGASSKPTEPTPLLNHETSDHLLSLVKTTCPSLDTKHL
jgi:hypothetical protein